MTPHEVWERQHEFVRAFDGDGQASLFAEDGVWELPFAPDGVPKQIVGRERIRQVGVAGMARAAASGRRIEGYRDVTVHETADPEVIVVEFTLEGRAADDSEYRTPYVQVVRVRDGEIVHLRDYFSPDVLRS